MADEVKVFDSTTENSAETLLGQDDAAFAESLGLDSETGKAKESSVPPRTPSEKKSAEVVERKVKMNEPMDVAKENFGADTAKTHPGYEEDKQTIEAKVEEAAKVETPIVEAEEEVEPPKLLTQFEVVQNGEDIEIPTDLRFSFKANQKDYKDIPLDKVVLWAQMGVHNEAREEEVRAAKQFVRETLDENEKIRGFVATLQKNQTDLLENEDLYIEARDRWSAQNTPEERARRAEQQLQQERATAAQRQADTQGAQYIESQIYPVLESLLTENKQVSEDEVLGRFNRLITPYLVNGKVPTQRLSDVKQMVDRDLKHYVTSLQLERDTKEKSQVQKTEQAVGAERQKAALAKRQTAKALKPKGSAVKETPKQRTYKSAEDWAEKALEDILTPVG